jgi:hypothetical protein
VPVRSELFTFVWCAGQKWTVLLCLVCRSEVNCSLVSGVPVRSELFTSGRHTVSSTIKIKSFCVSTVWMADFPKITLNGRLRTGASSTTCNFYGNCVYVQSCTKSVVAKCVNILLKIFQIIVTGYVSITHGEVSCYLQYSQSVPSALSTVCPICTVRSLSHLHCPQSVPSALSAVCPKMQHRSTPP